MIRKGRLDLLGLDLDAVRAGSVEEQTLGSLVPFRVHCESQTVVRDQTPLST